jgi:hypothetical protein
VRKNKTLTFTLKPSGRSDVVRLQEDLGEEYAADVIRLSLNLLATTVDAVKEGWALVLINEQGTLQRLVIPELESLRRRVKSPAPSASSAPAKAHQNAHQHDGGLMPAGAAGK